MLQKKVSTPKSQKMIQMVIIGQKVIYYGLKKTMMSSESAYDFFTKGLRVLRSPIAESFSLAARGHCNGGRFLVELPICKAFHR